MPVSISSYCYTSIGNLVVKIRRSHDHLIFIMGIPIHGKYPLDIETGSKMPFARYVLCKRISSDLVDFIVSFNDACHVRGFLWMICLYILDIFVKRKWRLAFIDFFFFKSPHLTSHASYASHIHCHPMLTLYKLNWLLTLNSLGWF